MCISVLLPLPELPMIATYSPRSIRSETPAQRAHLDVLAQPVDARDVVALDDRRGRARRGAAGDELTGSSRRRRRRGAPPPPPPKPPPRGRRRARRRRRRLRIALLSWSGAAGAAPSAARVERTTTLSPAFSPLTTCVVAVADHAGLHALGRAACRRRPRR